MSINKALIVADPWIVFPLNGTRTWEMRSSGASHRSWFGFIRKGTGAVYRVARLFHVCAPLSPTETIATIDHHWTPEAMIRNGKDAKWNTPWKLADVRRLPGPVPRVHKTGAATCVELDSEAVRGDIVQIPEAVSAISTSTSSVRSKAKSVDHGANSEAVRVDVGQRCRNLSIDTTWGIGQPEPASAVSRSFVAPPTKVSAPSPHSVPATTSNSSSRMIGEVEQTEGNIANSHFYLAKLMDPPPADAIGGSNRTSATSQQLYIDWGGPNEVSTDIDGQKRIFRSRAWMTELYKSNRAKAGDKVMVELTAPYYIRVGLK